MVYKQHYSQFAHYRTKKTCDKMRSGTIFLAAHVFLIRYFEQQIYILSKSVKTISSRENPSRRRAGGKMEGKKKGVPHCAFPWTTLMVKGSACKGLTSKWQEITDFEETPQRDLMLIGDCGCGSPAITYLSALEALIWRERFTSCHFEQTTPLNTR